MPNWNEVTSSAAKTEYDRVGSCAVYNPYNKTKSILFNRQHIEIYSDGNIIETPKGTINTQLTDPDKVLVLRHPETDVVLAESTYGMVHVYLYSLAYQEIAEFEAAEAARKAAEANPIV